MSIRIITKGLKTGTGVGGVKWILMRGLSSAPLVSRRQAIVSELKTILGTILKSNGYGTNIGSNVFEWRTTDFQESDLPAIDLRDTSEEVIPKGSRHFYTLQIEVEAKVAASTTTGKARCILADIQAIMGLNFNINNLAHKITPVGNELLDFEQNNKKLGTILINFEVEYATDAFNPYS